MKQFVIMKKESSPIFLTEASPHMVLPVETTRKQARQYVDGLNDRSMRNIYWLVKVNVMEQSEASAKVVEG